MFNEDSENILNRMLGNVPSDIDITEGSFIYDTLSPISLELAQSKILLDEVLSRVFAKTASENGYSTELEQRCNEFGITRKDGTKATTQVTFTGTDNIVIPLGTIVQTSGGLQYSTLLEVTTSSGVASVNVEATNIGNQYNIPANTIIELAVQIVGITGINNINPTSGGTEIENDADLYNRLILKVQNPTTSGNVANYKMWALAVEGISQVKVIPTWNGPGTVKVILLDSNKRAPTQGIIDNVVTTIEENRPIGATVTVQGATEVPINVTATLTLAEGASIEDAKILIEIQLTEYFKTLAFSDPIVRYTQIANAILDTANVIDYSNFKVNNGTANIQIASGSVAILGSVVVVVAA